MDSAEPRQDLDTTKIVQKSLTDLGRVLPSEASDLEKMLCVLNLQNEWSQVFTPENALNQILENALRISGAERAFIMTQKPEGFGYAAGMDGHNRKLSESQFKHSRASFAMWSRSACRFDGAGYRRGIRCTGKVRRLNLRAVACCRCWEFEPAATLRRFSVSSTWTARRRCTSLSGLDQKILSKLAVEAGNVLERVEMMKSIEQRKSLERDLALAEETQRSLLPCKSRTRPS